jgi:hypothetical protein
MHEEVMELYECNSINPNIEILNPKLDKSDLYDISDRSLIIDHINGDGRDNRVANLRQANYSQNSQNRRKISRRCASQYKGVGFSKKMKKWRAQICFGGRKKHLGYYSDKAEAARAYDAAAIKYHGRFAKLNFSKERDSRPVSALIYGIGTSRRGKQRTKK